MTALLCAVFFVSGAAALVFETLWFRQAGLGFGNSVWASSLVLAGFMAGLALGNGLAARFGERLRNAVRAYAVAEVVIALAGIALVLLLPGLGAALAPLLAPLRDQLWLLNLLRLLAAFLLLLIPSTAMGITLPLLTRALLRYDSNFGSVLGRLYGWNTLGAVCGALLGETLLLGVLGIRGTAFAAGGLNLLAALAAWSLGGRPVPPPAAPERAAAGPAPAPAAGWPWLLAVFLTGACLLALEVVWFRLLLLVVKGHAVAFALMLGVVLSGIGLGGLAGGAWLRRAPRASRWAAPLAIGAALLVVLSYALFPAILAPFEARLITDTGEILRVALPLMLPVSLLSGVFFTLAGAAFKQPGASETGAAGTLILFNTAGAALGSLAGGFLLLPALGIEKSFVAVALLYGAVGFLLFRSAPRAPLLAGGGLLVLAILLFPYGTMEQRLIRIPMQRALGPGAEARIEAVREGLGETVIYAQRLVQGTPVSRLMLTNAYSMSGTTQRSRRYMKLYVYLPAAIHPNLRSALLIGYGVGNTARAITDTRELTAIDLAELSRDILALSRVIYPDSAAGPLGDPRLRIHVEDGRYFLQTTSRSYDLITGEPPPPGIAGVENLYSREYFRLLRDRLAPGGMVSYWLPLHSLTDVGAKAVLRAFCEVFPDCSLWHGWGLDFMIVGTRDASGPVSDAHFLRQWSNPAVFPELKALGFERPEQLGALFIGDAAFLGGIIGDAEPLVDNRPKLIEAPLASREAAGAMLRTFTDAAAARERFRQSPLITRLWPARLREATLPYFEGQQLINALFFGGVEPGPDAIQLIHGLLTQSPLETTTLWLLGSDSDLQHLVTSDDPARLPHPVARYHLGLRLLAERRYADAVEPFRLAEQIPDATQSQNAFRFRIYALCMAGRRQEAETLARESLLRALQQRGVSTRSVQLPPFWLWIKQTFGIDPLPPS